MGVLIAVEGIDGAGKRTLTGRLVEAWRGGGLTVATAAFPRYGASVHADLGAEALRGGHGDLVDSVYGMALMWALDRRAADGDLAGMIAGHDVVLLDRYVASNAAYGAARLREGCDGPFTKWVRGLEFGRFGLPVPDAQLLLDVPVELARERAAHREAQDPSRSRDAYERDGALQQRVAGAYEALAGAAWVSPWEVASPDTAGSAVAVDALAARLVPGR
ncbi:dTMP kinase [Tomitella fengzijianii]|uniref:Thymidylate kinase n=1 Tax=Tomitella fengzijianii TaxID=2597660 RepID=A0A516X190_9ACTN|nr:dTMP kinase [Tomitella fengzijianii]QDQ96800.1 dTMP kinase [Tomitella fengzijianii]